MQLTLKWAAAAAFILSTGYAISADYVLNAFAPLVATGTHSVVSEDGIAQITGNIAGPLYVDVNDTHAEEGSVACKFSLTVDTGAQTESGLQNCTITYDDGAKVHADTTCTGFPGLGCSGEFNVTGGTKRFKGASGLGTVTFQTSSRVYQVTEAGELRETIFGMAYWDHYRFTLPD